MIIIIDLAGGIPRELFGLSSRVKSIKGLDHVLRAVRQAKNFKE
jgi:hypothetical protein